LENNLANGAAQVPRENEASGGDVSTASGFSRRAALRTIAAAAGSSLVDPGPVLARLIAGHDAQACGADPGPGRLVGTLPLSRPGGVVQPFGVKIGGEGLDARLNTDLSRLDADRLITPTDQIYVRTECPPSVAAHEGPWTIRGSGLVARPSALRVEDLARRARPLGAHLLECSGNNNPANFGLMSVAEWDGVPLLDVVDPLRPSSAATAVLVSGVDPEGPSSTSIAGASWVFPLSSLDSFGAFLAVRVNGEPLPLDHGRPVRLVVPGRYACAWIKWVDEIRLVDASEPSTGQMREFASRTHQTAAHDLAAAYAPPVIQTAATAVRVEKRQGPAGLEYRVVGIVWGGVRVVDRLAIRFNSAEPWQAFDVCPAPVSHRTWSLWSYRWKPAAPGVYNIALRVADASVPQRRLDSGYYVRQVTVDEI
jgi:DMSO/TMAO reductase YedYZ molybdopterin-dependent catalytic subunit